MKIFITVLIISALIQSSFLPVNLVLILLVSRSLIRPSSDNLWMAFLAGLFLAIMSSVNPGFYALSFLIIIELVQLIDKTNLTPNYVTVGPIMFLALLVMSLFGQLMWGQSFSPVSLIWQSILAWPIYLLIRFWEERFIPAPVIKLKIR